MMREVMLVGGPGDGRRVTVEHDQLRFRHVATEPVVWSASEIAEPVAASPIQTVYAPRRRGDYSWYPEGEK